MKKFSPWPYAIILFFIVIACVNGVLVYFATTSSRGLIESNPYEKGNNFQETVDAQEAARTHNISLEETIQVESVPPDFANVPILKIQIKQAQTIITSARLVALFRKPDDAKKDRQFELLPVDGYYQLPVKEMAGSWLVVYTLLWEGKKIRFDRSLLIL